MTVHCNDRRAKPKQLHASIPQCSCGRPVLYLIYPSTIQDIIPPTIDLHTFADDHGLKNHFKSGDLMLYNILEVCYDIYKGNEIKIKMVRIKMTDL